MERPSLEELNLYTQKKPCWPGYVIEQVLAEEKFWNQNVEGFLNGVLKFSPKSLKLE